MPTTLPHRPRADVKRSPRRIVFDILFNGAMLVSALILTFIVLVREEQFAFGEQQIANRTMQLHCTIQDGDIWLGDGDKTLAVHCEELRA